MPVAAAVLLLLGWQRPAPWPSGRAAGGVLTEVKQCFARSVAGWETHQELLNKSDALQSFLHTFAGRWQASPVTKWSTPSMFYKRQSIRDIVQFSADSKRQALVSSTI